jgi:lysophospholipase L1-like esterase
LTFRILFLLASLCSQLPAFDTAPLAGAFAKARKTGAMRVLFSGTSITCGTGASDYSHSFPARIVSSLEEDLKVKVQGPNICFGGALAVTQLALLKQEGLKWAPDLIVLEAGTLDSFSPELALPAIESIFRLAIARHIPIVAFHPFTSYAAAPKRELFELAALYGVPIADVSEAAARRGLKLTDLSTDFVHPNDRGHALIFDAVRGLFATPLPSARGAMPRRYQPDLDRIRFIPASAFSTKSKALPLARFKGAGKAAEIHEAEIKMRSSIAVLIFSFGKSAKLEYQIDTQPWTKAAPQPNWFLNYALMSEKKPAQHHLRLRVETVATIDGILVSE